MGVTAPPAKGGSFRVSVAPESTPPRWAFALAYRVAAVGIAFGFSGALAVFLGAMSGWRLSSTILVIFGSGLTGILLLAERLRDLAYDRRRAQARAREDQRVVEHLLAIVEASDLQTRYADGQMVWAAAGWSARGLLAKRFIDLVGASIGLILSAPLFTMVALLIKLDSPGPIIVTKRRLGANGEPIAIPSFRILEWDASTPSSAQLGPERSGELTRVGAFLHRTSVDALPSLFLVLKGTLSLVGPLPGFPGTLTEVPLRLARPGLVSWGIADQLWRNRALDLHDYVASQIEYVRGWTIRRDLIALLSTVWIVLSGVREID